MTRFLLLVCAIAIAFTASEVAGGICPFRMYMDNVPFTPDTYTLPNSLCIYPDGRTSLSNAVAGNFAISYGIALEHMDYDTGWTLYNYPQQGLLLENGVGTVSLCDTTNTFLLRIPGFPVFGYQPVYGGGHSPVDASGQPIPTAVFYWAPDEFCGRFAVPLFVNSPDINGDLVVNLTDTILFAADAQAGAPYNYRSDFDWSGIVNLSDTAVFTSAIGATCSSR